MLYIGIYILYGILSNNILLSFLHTFPSLDDVIYEPAQMTVTLPYGSPWMGLFDQD